MDKALKRSSIGEYLLNSVPLSPGRAATKLGKPFDALNACLHRACRDACFELVEKLRAGLSPLTSGQASHLSHETTYSHTSSVYAICPATCCSRHRGLCSDRQYFGGG